jgi:hypothetical protein
VKRVRHNCQSCISERFEIYELGEALNIGSMRIDSLERRFVWLGGAALAELGGARFDVARDLGQRGPTVRSGELQALIFGRVVAGRKVDGPVHLTPPDLVGNCRRRHGVLAEKHLNAMLAKDFPGRARKFLSEKSSVVCDDQGRLRVAAPNVLRDRRCHQSNVRKGKILSDNRSPT